MNDSRKVRVTLDADHQGHIIVFLAAYHTWITEQWELGEIESRNFAETCYLLGNIEGRALYNGLTQKDLDLIEAWEEEYEQAEH